LVEAQNFDEEMAKELGARHIVLLGEGGVLRVKTWQGGRFCEKPVTKPEIIDYIKKNLISNPEAAIIEPIYNLTRNNSITTISNKNQAQPINQNVNVGVAKMQTIIIMAEKLTVNKKKRLENQVEQKLSNVLGKFSKKEYLTMFAVELSSAEIKALICCIDPIPGEQQAGGDSASELDLVMER
jgi:translation initiation factor 2-alpha kinase 4